MRIRDSVKESVGSGLVLGLGYVIQTSVAQMVCFVA